MALTPHTRLGAYEIIAPIGAGGMGEVYRAHDDRLGRDVAVKVLPSSVSADPGSLARFEREARAIGALNHPNIINIFDVGSQNGVSYVVMELLEGETLRGRLHAAAGEAPVRSAPSRSKAESESGNPPEKSTGTNRASGTARSRGLPRKKALEIAQQIATGLAAAHARGIVHRDLKPENIFLTHDGRVKILDFGLARAVPKAVQDVADARTELSPNVADSVPGMIMGTIGYMAPEQVRGQAVDHRADIFAFGAVLYEMLTGERAFDAESPIETMTAILKADPLEQPVAAVALSGPLEPLVRHCLEKQPDERFQSARDLAFRLQEIASGALSTGAAERAVGRTSSGFKRFLTPAAIAIALVVGVAIGSRFQRGTPDELITLAVPMLQNVRIAQVGSPARSGGIAVSRDGRRIAFVGATASTDPQIFVRSLDSPVIRAVPGTEGALFPSWSPDGRRLAFAQGRKLRQVALEGGSPQNIADMGNPRSAAAWGDDDTLLYHAEYRLSLLRVPAAGGTPADVLPAPKPNVAWFSPVWLPDNRRFLVVRFAYVDDEAKDAGIYVGSIDSTSTTLLVPGRISEVAIGDGELFYRRGMELVAQPFDLDVAKVSGPPRVLSDHVSMVAAAHGTLAYFDPPEGLAQGHRITWFSRTGAIVSHVGEVGTFRDPKLSPDGRALAVARADENGLFSIWTYDLARNIDLRVTPPGFVSPAWTRDGRWILAGNASGLLRFDLAGGGAPQMIRASSDYMTILDTTPDGRDAVVQVVGATTTHLATLALNGKSDPRRIGVAQPLINQNASLSADGRWVVLVAQEGATRRLFVQPYPGPGARIPVTKSEGSYPIWRGDARELYFVVSASGPNASVMAVPVAWTANVPDFGTPQVLFKIERPVLANLAFDATHDGQKFVAIVSDEPDPSPLTVRIRIK